MAAPANRSRPIGTVSPEGSARHLVPALPVDRLADSRSASGDEDHSDGDSSGSSPKDIMSTERDGSRTPSPRRPSPPGSPPRPGNKAAHTILQKTLNINVPSAKELAKTVFNESKGKKGNCPQFVYSILDECNRLADVVGGPNGLRNGTLNSGKNFSALFGISVLPHSPFLDLYNWARLFYAYLLTYQKGNLHVLFGGAQNSPGSLMELSYKSQTPEQIAALSSVRSRILTEEKRTYLIEVFEELKKLLPRSSGEPPSLNIYFWDDFENLVGGLVGGKDRLDMLIQQFKARVMSDDSKSGTDQSGTDPTGAQLALPFRMQIEQYNEEKEGKSSAKVVMSPSVNLADVPSFDYLVYEFVVIVLGMILINKGELSQGTFSYCDIVANTTQASAVRDASTISNPAFLITAMSLPLILKEELIAKLGRETYDKICSSIRSYASVTGFRISMCESRTRPPSPPPDSLSSLVEQGMFAKPPLPPAVTIEQEDPSTKESLAKLYEGTLKYNTHAKENMAVEFMMLILFPKKPQRLGEQLKDYKKLNLARARSSAQAPLKAVKTLKDLQDAVDAGIAFLEDSKPKEHSSSQQITLPPDAMNTMSYICALLLSDKEYGMQISSSEIGALANLIVSTLYNCPQLEISNSAELTRALATEYDIPWRIAGQVAKAFQTRELRCSSPVSDPGVERRPSLGDSTPPKERPSQGDESQPPVARSASDKDVHAVASEAAVTAGRTGPS